MPGNLYLNGPINLNNKRPKLNTEQNKPMFYNPLIIDTHYDSKRDGSTYVPQVEAISPTNLDEKNGENRITKDEILNSIGKLDRELQQTEDKISKCKKRQKELELTNSPSNGNQTENSDPSDLKQLSTTQQVYTENKEKAEQSQRKFDKIRPLTIAVSGSRELIRNSIYSNTLLLLSFKQPLYNQPSDLPFYFKNKEKFRLFKPKLVTYFKKRLLYKQKREKYLTSSYEKLMNNWLKSSENKTNGGIKKSKDLKLREYFERQFAEIKKAREEKQSRKPKGENGESQAEIDSQLEAEQEAENKRMRSLAVIPPILLDNKLIKYKFFNKNGLVIDPVSKHKELQVSCISGKRTIFSVCFEWI